MRNVPVCGVGVFTCSAPAIDAFPPTASFEVVLPTSAANAPFALCV